MSTKMRPPSRLRRSLRAGTLDATAHAVMVGCGETYFPAFALLLLATPTQVGILATVPILVGSAFQLLAPHGARLMGNKRWVVGSALVQAMTFVPILLLAGGGDLAFWQLLGWVSLYWALALGISPAWNAWMGRMIPPEVRSRYFGRRNVLVQAALLIALLASGMLLQLSSDSHWGAAAGFATLFGLAATARLVSVGFLTRQHEPAAEVKALPATEVRALLSDLLRQPYGRIIRLVVLMNGAVHFSAAYFTPFMLQELDLSYAQFTILNSTILVARVLASSYWGEIARTFGNRRTLQVAAVLLVPLSGLWVVSRSFSYLIALQLYAGFAWAGFELLTILSFFDCTDERNRAQVLSVYNLLNGFAIVVSTLLGGLVLHVTGPEGYLYIFFTSSVLRAVTVIFFSGRVGHKRAGEYSFSDVFARVVTFRPAVGPQLRPLPFTRRREARRPERQESQESMAADERA